jgi:AraC-like DNA-binding protein
MPQSFREFFSGSGHAESDVLGFYLHHRDMPIKEIASRTGKSTTEVYRIIRKFGHEPNRLGAGHHHVRTFLSAGMSPKEVSRLTGYTPRNIRYLRRGLEKE